MALGKYARVDGHNSSNYCLTISIAVFVSTCLIGAWMTMSSSIDPARLGITLQQFMGVMPKKISGSKADLPENSLKANSSQNMVPDAGNPNMNGNESLLPDNVRSSEPAANNKDESKVMNEDKTEKDFNAPKVEEKSISGDSGENKKAGERNSGQERTDTSDQDLIKNNENSIPQTHDGDEKPGQQKSPEEKQIGETETQIDKNGGYQDKISLDKEGIDATTTKDGVVDQGQNSGQEQSKGSKGDSNGKASEHQSKDWTPMPNETSHDVVPWPTQSAESEREIVSEGLPSSMPYSDYKWKVCNVTAGQDYIPCLDNIKALKKLRSTRHYEHRERHCPDEAPTCLVPVPKAYKTPIKWPKSRDMIWFSNVPHTKLAEYKGKQNWVKVYDRYLTFPGGGTQFKFGALHYIDYLQESVPEILWGKQSRVLLDIGCGVASFGGYLFERDVLAMSLAPKDEHEAQVQFALERGIPAISAVMGTKRLPFPSMVFDIVHCARCRVPWHIEGGKLLIELDRLLRPGGYFVWSATPVYRKDTENAGIWKAMSELTKSMCWELVKVERDVVNRKSAAVFRKPTSNDCYEGRPKNEPPLCKASDNPNAAWNTRLQSCIHKVPQDSNVRGSQWPDYWPSRLEKPPYWLKAPEVGASPKDFIDDHNHWKHVVADIYLNGIGVDWSSVRNVMDMRASYGGFAAALKDLKVWVMNVVPVNSSDTLPIIYERGLFGMYHDWCESFSTYPRSYDLLHADSLFSDLKKRCNFVSVMAEVDRILRPGGRLVVRDDVETISEVKGMANSLHWKIQYTSIKDSKGLLCVEKTMWRPSEVETIL